MSSSCRLWVQKVPLMRFWILLRWTISYLVILRLMNAGSLTASIISSLLHRMCLPQVSTVFWFSVLSAVGDLYLKKIVTWSSASLIIYFPAVLGWQNTCESVGDITATLSALSTEVDISVLYHGLAPKNKHCLISMVNLFIFFFIVFWENKPLNYMLRVSSANSSHH